MPTTPDAAILIIGDEILSGRTQDINVAFIARFLGALGIPVKEVRVVSDVEVDIVAAVNALRARYRYLFTTGGIGPTHDDITADSVAKALDVGISEHPEALAMLASRYAAGDLNEARRRMARVPHGATLIPNTVSTAPGFQIENVFVMAGVPAVMQAMMDTIAGRLETGPKLLSRSVGVFLGEGQIAKGLAEIQKRYVDLPMGSYPFMRAGRYGTTLVVRGTDAVRIRLAAEEISAMIRALGAEPMPEEG